MSAGPARLLYVTDLAYQARDRRYGDEDVAVTAQLSSDFTIALCHPTDVVALMDGFDVVVVRNSGPVLGYQQAYDDFRREAVLRGTRVYNPLDGKADMVGKQYLVDLSAAGYPVIPTVDRAADLHRLPDVPTYVVKPKLGADSIGMRIVPTDDLDQVLAAADTDEVLVQPHIDFTYEASFYFVDDQLHYALSAPNPDQRWVLEPYEPTADDRRFAQRFIDWNDLDHGIQRVDACRTRDGDLLLVELEDLNPYLSLDRVDQATRTAFVTHMAASIRSVLSG